MKTIPTTSIVQPTPFVSTPPAPPPITFPTPLSYDFQVVEYMKDGKLAKVELQCRVNNHDQYGNMVTEGFWTAVPRVQMPLP